MRYIFAFIILFTSFLSARTYHEIIKSGQLNVGIRVRNGVLSADKTSGFHYDFIKAFAIKNGLTLNLVIKKQISDYFQDDTFKNIDIIVDNLSFTEKRAEKIDFIPLFEYYEIIVSAPDRKTPYKKINDEVIIVAKNSTYHKTMKKKESFFFKTKLNYFYSKTTGDQYQDLLDGKGTVTLLDSNLAVLRIKDISQIRYSTMASDLNKICWAVSKNGGVLAYYIKQYLTHAKLSGLFGEIWDVYSPKVSYSQYLAVLELTQDKTIPFQKEINNMIEEGGVE